MKIRFAAPVASAAAAILMLAACSDDDTTADDEGTTTTEEQTTTTAEGSTTLAKGDVRFAPDAGLLASQTMDLTALEHDDQVSGEARFSFGLELDLQCANTDTDLVIVGGEVTAEEGDSAEVGDKVAVLVREGDPDSVFVWYELPLPEGEVAAGSCQELVDSIADDPSTDDPFADVADGDDIETG